MKEYWRGAILYLIISIFDLCDSTCDEYTIIFQEDTYCGVRNYTLLPLKINEIDSTKLTYPFNTTDIDVEINRYKECILELSWFGTSFYCDRHQKPVHYTSKHLFIPDNSSTLPTLITAGKSTATFKTTPDTTTAESPDTSKTTAESPDTSMTTAESNNTSMTKAESPDTFMTTAESNNTSTTTAESLDPSMTTAESNNTSTTTAESPDTSMTTAESNNTSTTTAESLDPSITTTKSNYTSITTAKSNDTSFTTAETKNPTTESSNASTIITEISDTPNANKGSSEKPIPGEEGDLNKYDVNLVYFNYNNSSDIINNKSTSQEHIVYCYNISETICSNEKHDSAIGKKIDKETNPKKSIGTLKIAVKRDTRVDSPIQPIFTGNIPILLDDGYMYVEVYCDVLKHEDCKHNNNKQVNVYLKSNHIKNNTTIKYSNCLNKNSSSNISLDLDCDATEFAAGNSDLFTLKKRERILAVPSGVESLTCKAVKIKNSITTKKKYHYNVILFNNCTKNASGGSNFSSEVLSKTESTDNSNVSTSNPESGTTIYLIENGSNCSQNMSYNIHEAKIIDFGVKTTQPLLENNIMEINVTNCIHLDSSITDNKQIHEVELHIILRNESSNTPSLALNEIPKATDVDHKIVLQCDNLSSNTTDKTLLQCQSILSNHTSNTEVTKKNKNKENKVKENKVKEKHSNNVNKNVQSVHFNRKKDIPGDLGEQSYLNNDRAEKIMLIVISSIAGGGILIMVAIRIWSKSKGYIQAPTREPQINEETAF